MNSGGPQAAARVAPDASPPGPPLHCREPDTAPTMKSLPLRWKLALIPAALALLLAAVMLALTHGLVGRHLAQGADARIGLVAEQIADRMARAVNRRVGEMLLLSRSAALQSGEPGARRAELEWLRGRTPGYAWLGLTDLDGRVLAATDGALVGQSIAARPVFVQGQRALWVGDVHPAVALAPLRVQPGAPAPELIDIALPLHDAAGRAVGVLAAHVSWAWLTRLGDAVVGSDRDDGLRIVVLSAAGVPLLSELDADGSAALVEALRRADPQAARLDFSVGGRGQIAALRRVGPADGPEALGWRVGAVQDLDTALAPVLALQRSAALGGLLAALLAGVLGYGLSSRLSRPYAGLLEAATQRFARGRRPAAQELTGYLDALGSQLRGLPDPPAGDAPLSSDALLGLVLRDARRLQALADHLPAAVFLVDNELRVQYWNHACERTFGWRADEARGRPVDELLRGDALRPGGAALLARLRDADDAPSAFEARVERRDGSTVWGEWRLSRLVGDDGRRQGLVAQVRDATAEHQLREHEATLAAVIRGASDAVISTDETGRISLFNPAAERIFGRRADALIGQGLESLLPAPFRARHGGDLAGFAASRVSRRAMGAGRVQGLHADGSLIELEASISQVTVGERKVLTAILRDVTERVRAERAVAQYQLELTGLTQQLMAQEKATTRRLAQQLHDQLGQTLAAIRLVFDTGATVADPEDAARHARLDRMIDQAIREVRQALVELRPALLDEQGLAAALDNELRTRRPASVGVDLLLDAAPELTGQRWSADVEYAAFMVAREAIGNAVRHAGATLVRVLLHGGPAALRLEVVDDGGGLADDALQGRPGHLGMVGMRERALAIGALFEVVSRPGEGTTVRLVWEDRRP